MTHGVLNLDLDDDSSRTVTWIGHAYWGTDKDGVLVMDFTGVDHDWGNPDILKAGALTGTGHGNWYGFITMGREVEPTGSGERDVEVVFNGHKLGEMVAGGGDAEASITGVVENLDANSKAKVDIGSYYESVVGYNDINTGFSKSLQTELDPDDSYFIYVKLEVQVWSAWAVQATASADFGPFDVDDGKVDLDSIEIHKL
ncbi:MAG: hypothetical protein ABEJ42_09460 [Halobacteriaceae archaeon]